MSRRLDPPVGLVEQPEDTVADQLDHAVVVVTAGERVRLAVALSLGICDWAIGAGVGAGGVRSRPFRAQVQNLNK